eukprot:Hpha_TRINITY_DN14816_c0_g1::TRINITY_DN14816_c0_g1_i1::g.170066::m.170066
MAHTGSTVVFISCSALGQEGLEKIPESVRDSCLLLFGSKRKWVFPEGDEEEREAQGQPGHYHLMSRAFLDWVLIKEQRGQVHFLKKPDLKYLRYPGPRDGDAYSRVSVWLQGMGYNPLRLEPEYWNERNAKEFRYCKDPARVIRNFVQGFHEYDELKELLAASDARFKPMK